MSFSPAFSDHLDGECTTVCHCWKVTRRDSTILGFTDHDRELTVAGQAYAPESGFTQSEAVASLTLAADAAEVEGALSSDVITEADLLAGLYDGAQVETLLVNWADVSQFGTIRRAVVGKITRTDGRFVAELMSPAASLDRPNGRFLRRRCDARLGDARCQAAIGGAAFNGEGSVLAVPAAATVVVSGLGSFDAGWFSHGELTWQGGVSAGRRTTVVDHRVTAQGAELQLAPHGGQPQAGDPFSVVAGCDKQFATCKAKFSNHLNFRGFPHLPGNDAAYAYVNGEGTFDGGALVE